MSPFEIVYGFNPQSPIDLLPLPSNEQGNVNFRDRANKIKELHAKVKENLDKTTERYAHFKNRGRKQVEFQPGDWVWLHLRKERFPAQRRSKLLPRGDGPFQVVEKINENAYKLDLPGEYNVHTTFNVSDLSHFDVGDERLMEQPLQEEGDGVNTIEDKDDTKFPIGPITRSRAKRYQIKMNSICQLWFNDHDLDDSLLDHGGKDVCVLKMIGPNEASNDEPNGAYKYGDEGMEPLEDGTLRDPWKPSVLGAAMKTGAQNAIWAPQSAPIPGGLLDWAPQ